MGGFPRGKVKLLQVGRLEGVTGVERIHAVSQDVFSLAAELALDDSGELFPVEVEHGADHPEDEDVLAAVLGGASDGFHGRRREWDADVMNAPLVSGLLNLLRIVEADATVLEGLQVAVVAVLVEGYQDVCLIPGMEDFPGAEVNLENGWAARDGGRNGHVGHDILSGATGESAKHAAHGLNPILGIPSEADHYITQSIVLGCLC